MAQRNEAFSGLRLNEYSFKKNLKILKITFFENNNLSIRYVR